MKSRDSTGYYHAAPIATCNNWSPGTCGRSARRESKSQQLTILMTNYPGSNWLVGASQQNIWISLGTLKLQKSVENWESTNI